MSDETSIRPPAAASANSDKTLNTLHGAPPTPIGENLSLDASASTLPPRHDYEPPSSTTDCLPESNGDVAAPAPTGFPSIGGYELLGELGRGGMGVVYKARYVALDRIVALKMILAGGHASASDLARFKAEALAVSRLQHANIVQIFGTGEEDGKPYFSLEFCGGGSLEGKLKGQPQHPREAAALLQTLAPAMHAAHERGIVHRDLKPANVLLSPKSETRNPKTETASVSDFGFRISDFVPKITDFGLAKKVEADGSSSGQTASGTIVGTPSYMAPEQAAGQVKEIGPAADVYALGAMLYELLTGRPPFRADTLMNTLRQVLDEEPVPPRRLQVKVPVDLETICLKCLEKPARKRYTSAKELADDVGRYLAGEPILARPVGTVGRLVKWARRRPAVAALSAVILLIATVGFGLVTWKWLEADHQRAKADAARQKADEEKSHALAEQRKAELLSTRLAFQQGLELCDRGEVPSGMLHMARSLDKAVAYQASELEPVIRANLGAWAGQLHPLRWRLDHPAAVHAAALAPNGIHVATGCDDGKLRLWDTKTGQTLFEHKHTHPIRATAFSPDGKTLLAGDDDGTVWFVDVARPEAVAAASPHKARIDAALFSRDGSLAVTADLDGLVQCWDPRTRLPLRAQTFAVKVSTAQLDKSGRHRLALSKDGSILAVALDENVAVWNTRAEMPPKELLPKRMDGAPRRVVQSLDVSADGQSVVAGCFGRVFLFDLPTSGYQEFPQGGTVWTVAFRPNRDRSFLAGSGDNTARVRDAEKGKTGESLLLKHANQVFFAVYSPDGKTIATSTRDAVRIWRADTGEQVGSSLPQGGGGDASVPEFSEDGRMLLTRSPDMAVRVWDLMAPPDEQRAFGKDVVLRALQLSRDGETLLTGWQNGSACFWKRQGGDWVKTEEILDEGHRLNGAAFHDAPDRRTLLIGWQNRAGRPGGGATVRTTRDGKTEVVTLPHPNPVLAVALSPDGRMLATGSGDKTLRVWHRDALDKPLCQLELPGRFYAFSFSPDSKTLACSIPQVYPEHSTIA